jgi:hypothetical protein
MVASRRGYCPLTRTSWLRLKTTAPALVHQLLRSTCMMPPKRVRSTRTNCSTCMTSRMVFMASQLAQLLVPVPWPLTRHFCALPTTAHTCLPLQAAAAPCTMHAGWAAYCVQPCIGCASQAASWLPCSCRGSSSQPALIGGVCNAAVYEHALVNKLSQALADSQHRFVIVEAPLLYVAGVQSFCAVAKVWPAMIRLQAALPCPNCSPSIITQPVSQVQQL